MQHKSVSWTQIFPCLTEDLLEAFESKVSKEDKREFEELLGVERVIRPDSTEFEARSAKGLPRKLVSISLFWKNLNESDIRLPTPTLHRLLEAKRLGLVKRFSPWDAYFEPSFTYAGELMDRHPNVIFRVYLANDLHFLIEDLVEAGWEVFLMMSSSICYCPGGFWRFLALDERDCLVTIVDADRVKHVDSEIDRTEVLEVAKLGLWRVPGYYNSELSEGVYYRPILGGHFGARGGLVNVRRLIEAFIWYWRRAEWPQKVTFFGIGEIEIKHRDWPNYGFDEWFLMVALYPRFAKEGILTFLPSDARSQLLPLDIEYVTWANSNSEVIYF